MAVLNSESRGLIAWLSSCCGKGGVRFSVEFGVLWTSARGAIVSIRPSPERYKYVAMQETAFVTIRIQRTP
jgi:hypothetical protein